MRKMEVKVKSPGEALRLFHESAVHDALVSFEWLPREGTVRISFSEEAPSAGEEELRNWERARIIRPFQKKGASLAETLACAVAELELASAAPLCIAVGDLAGFYRAVGLGDLSAQLMADPDRQAYMGLPIELDQELDKVIVVGAREGRPWLALTIEQE